MDHFSLTLPMGVGPSHYPQLDLVYIIWVSHLYPHIILIFELFAYTIGENCPNDSLHGRDPSSPKAWLSRFLSPTLAFCATPRKGPGGEKTAKIKQVDLQQRFTSLLVFPRFLQLIAIVPQNLLRCNGVRRCSLEVWSRPPHCCTQVEDAPENRQLPLQGRVNSVVEWPLWPQQKGGSPAESSHVFHQNSEKKSMKPWRPPLLEASGQKPDSWPCHVNASYRDLSMSICRCHEEHSSVHLKTLTPKVPKASHFLHFGASKRSTVEKTSFSNTPSFRQACRFTTWGFTKVQPCKWSMSGILRCKTKGPCQTSSRTLLSIQTPRHKVWLWVKNWVPINRPTWREKKKIKS